MKRRKRRSAPSICSVEPKSANNPETLPHPGPLPLGEGESSFGVASHLSRSRQDAHRKNSTVRRVLPLPAGEGRGEGEVPNRSSAPISPKPSKVEHSLELVSELLILPDGRVLVHNLTPAFANLLHELNPDDRQIHPRSSRKSRTTHHATRPHELPN